MEEQVFWLFIYYKYKELCLAQNITGGHHADAQPKMRMDIMKGCAVITASYAVLCALCVLIHDNALLSGRGAHMEELAVDLIAKYITQFWIPEGFQPIIRYTLIIMWMFVIVLTSPLLAIYVICRITCRPIISSFTNIVICLVVLMGCAVVTMGICLAFVWFGRVDVHIYPEPKLLCNCSYLLDRNSLCH